MQHLVHLLNYAYNMEPHRPACTTHLTHTLSTHAPSGQMADNPKAFKWRHKGQMGRRALRLSLRSNCSNTLICPQMQRESTRSELGNVNKWTVMSFKGRISILLHKAASSIPCEQHGYPMLIKVFNCTKKPYEIIVGLNNANPKSEEKMAKTFFRSRISQESKEWQKMKSSPTTVKNQKNDATRNNKIWINHPMKSYKNYHPTCGKRYTPNL